MSKALVLAETENAARELCAGARTMADEVVLVTDGIAPSGIADTVMKIAIPDGNIADDAYVVVNGVFDAQNPHIVLAEPQMHVLSLLGRLAAHAGASAITGVVAFEGDAAESMYFGGTGTRVAKPTGDVGFYTVGSGIFDASEAVGTDIVQEISFTAPANAVKKLAVEELPPVDVDLHGADVVVACGRGFQAEEDLGAAREFAAKAGAELGCSRPLAEGVDWFPREAYVGVSGAMISPKVYMAVGISGQMQHMVGCTGADTIIAINKDKNAPIFDQCDLGFVGDLKTALPALTEAL